MQFSFSEDLKYLFPYWVEAKVLRQHDDFSKIMDIQDWLGKMFGPIGETWGFEKKVGQLLPNSGLRHYNNSHEIIYCWRFKNKADAALFKLTWAN